MKYLFAAILFLLFKATFAQVAKAPVAVTPVLEKKLKKEIEKEASRLIQNLKKEDSDSAVIEFSVDTFRIERYMTDYMEYDWTTAGMAAAGNEAIASYDSLMHKYYRKLLVMLNPNDRDILVRAQEAWVQFRTDELQLLSTISKDQYSGGGTIQKVANASYGLDLVKRRTIDMFQHYLRALQVDVPAYGFAP